MTVPNSLGEAIADLPENVIPLPSQNVGECHYCGTFGGMTRDHIVPASLGGPDGGWNIVRACTKCNYDKADKWPTCGCDQCIAAVERFLEDETLRERARGIVMRRIREFDQQLSQIDAARSKIVDRSIGFTELLVLLTEGSS